MRALCALCPPGRTNAPLVLMFAPKFARLPKVRRFRSNAPNIGDLSSVGVRNSHWRRCDWNSPCRRNWSFLVRIHPESRQTEESDIDNSHLKPLKMPPLWGFKVHLDFHSIDHHTTASLTSIWFKSLRASSCKCCVRFHCCVLLVTVLMLRGPGVEGTT